MVTDYVIKIGNITIEPLWVEAYYSNVAKEFADPFIHGKEEQSESAFYTFTIRQMIPEVALIFVFRYVMKPKTSIIFRICLNIPW